MPRAIIICGTPGSGKSTYARRLCTVGMATLLDIDTATERLVKVGLVEAGHSPDDRDSGYFKATYREPVYQALFDVARDNLPYHDVIITGPFTREIQDPGWPGRLSRTLGGSVEVHYVHCPPEVRRQRLIERGDERDLAKLADWEKYLRYYGEESPPVFEHVLVDGTAADY